METKCIAVKVGKPLWKAITIAAMEGDSTIQDLVVPVLEREFGGLVQKPSPVDRKQPAVKSQGNIPVRGAEVAMSAAKSQPATRTGGATPPTGANSLNKPLNPEMPKACAESGGVVKFPPYSGPPNCIGVPDDTESSVKHQCAICRSSFPEPEMTYHPKTMKWACKECADNQRNGQ